MTTETISAADLAKESAPTAPAPSPTAAPAPVPAPAAAPAPTASSVPPAPPPAELDALGRPFDATKFAPKKDTKGRWVNKNAGRKPRETPAAAPGSTAAPGAAPGAPASYVPPDPAAPPPAPSAAAPDRFDLAAEMYCRAGYSVLDGVFSADGEWLPESDGEHVALRTSLATYLRHKQTDDLPPGAALALAVATYGAKRFTKPRTMSRLRLFVYWAKSSWYSFRTGRKLEELPPFSAPPASGETGPLPPQVNLGTPAAANSTP